MKVKSAKPRIQLVWETQTGFIKSTERGDECEVKGACSRHLDNKTTQVSAFCYGDEMLCL